MSRGVAFAPATVGNVGPGFDVLGLAVGGAGDTVAVQLGGAVDVVTITGRDAGLLPTAPDRNAASIAAHAMLAALGLDQPVAVTLEKGLAVSGGMGGSAASSVAGALAAALAAQATVSSSQLMAAALAGESAVAGAHLDNIAPCVLGGVALCLDSAALDVVAVPLRVPLWVALVSPAIQVETRAARALLPAQSPRAEWIAQMAHTSALVLALTTGDLPLLRRALNDRFAEPRRAALIPGFDAVKAAALAAGALGCSISGAGPTVFALADSQQAATRCATDMHHAFGVHAGAWHVGPVSSGAGPAQS